MKNFKNFIAILLAIFGLAFASSCSKDATCECDVANDPDVKINIDIKKGKCEDLKGQVTYDGLSVNIEDCKEK